VVASGEHWSLWGGQEKKRGAAARAVEYGKNLRLSIAGRSVSGTKYTPEDPIGRVLIVNGLKGRSDLWGFHRLQRFREKAMRCTITNLRGKKWDASGKPRARPFRWEKRKKLN